MSELKHCGTVTIETERLILRRFTVNDAQNMYDNWASDEQVTKYLTWPTHSSAEATAQLLAQWVEDYNDPTTYDWAIELKSICQVIGNLSVVSFDEKTLTAELGWCMSRAYWGQGIMPEAAAAVRDYLFDQVGFNRLQAKHDLNNPKSGRVMQKIGMVKEGCMRSGGHNNQGICDLVIYGMLKTDNR